MKSRLSILPAFVFAIFAGVAAVSFAQSAEEAPNPPHSPTDRPAAAEPGSPTTPPPATEPREAQPPAMGGQQPVPADTPPVGANRPDAAQEMDEPVTRTAAGNGDGEYVVQQGDTLAEIAREELGDASRWKQIADLNELENPDMIIVGARLRLPER